MSHSTEETPIDIENVALVGGTHGNEITGVYAVEQWMQPSTSPAGITKPDSFKLQPILANPKAITHNRRYMERDLNRCFQLSELEDGDLTLYEECRAKAINQLIGYRSHQQADYIIDLHTTTSNMGSSIVITSLDAITFNLAAFLLERIPDLKIYYEDISPNESPYLFSLGRLGGILIEIGPTPQGVVRADIYQKTLAMVNETLSFIHLHNNNSVPKLAQTLPAFQPVEGIQFPTDSNGQLSGMIHESLQDQDFEPLKQGDPLFRLFDGTERFFELPPGASESVYYPAFTNEAAYYDHYQALQLMKKIEIKFKNHN